MTGSKAALAVLISGHGSNLQAIIDSCNKGEIAASIRCVISNEAKAYGLQRAQQANIPTNVLSHTEFSDRKLFDDALANLIDGYNVDLIVLAGFMRILGADFIKRYEHRIINIHPSLLPKYKGLDTHARVLSAGDKIHGASVHFVTADLDGGPVITQESIPVESSDTAETLQQKVHRIEHEILPRTIGWFADNRLRVVDGKVFLDGKLIDYTNHS
ncbi:MAG: phosphoribosylglycinamide formyltransferase [Arenicellales bacterium]|nr:phosphoribosylglycinamide formyltransferase [Arenicellales bacterium]